MAVFLGMWNQFKLALDNKRIYISLIPQYKTKMLIFFLIIGLATILFGGAIALLVYQVRSGQLDDMDTPPLRMLANEELLNQDESAKDKQTTP